MILNDTIIILKYFFIIEFSFKLFKLIYLEIKSYFFNENYMRIIHKQIMKKIKFIKKFFDYLIIIKYEPQYFY